MIQPGTYKAKLVSHAISETKNGDPQAAITFSFDDGSGQKQMTYFGSFKDGAAKHTLKALLVCGLKGNNPAGALEVGREVNIVIDEEEGQDGKVRSKIRWVNALGGIRNVIGSDVAKAKLSALEGAVMAARHDLGIADDDDSIPF